MNTTFEIATDYIAIQCGGCGVPFAMSQSFYEQRQKDHEGWYCLRDRLEGARRSRAALKGQVTKIKRRVSKGICPCCRRNFANLKRHMEGQHPDWSEES